MPKLTTQQKIAIAIWAGLCLAAATGGGLPFIGG
jgi:hypothetical protein